MSDEKQMRNRKRNKERERRKKPTKERWNKEDINNVY
jgi:hypothetical protein